MTPFHSTEVNKKHFLVSFLLLIVVAGTSCINKPHKTIECISYEIDLNTQALQLFWKDEQGQRFGSIGNLKNWLDSNNQHLLFAMNAGMYKPDHTPQGLFIQDRKVIVPLDTASGSGNFYLKPNGVFYTTTTNKGVVCTSKDFKIDSTINYATQSGPMLLIDGAIHPAFKEGSVNVNIRNGVGILPNGHLHFAMSKKEVNLYEFADYFRSLGCRNALYLDGLVSRAYVPEKNWRQEDGDFGVIIAVTTTK